MSATTTLDTNITQNAGVPPRPPRLTKGQGSEAMYQTYECLLRMRANGPEEAEAVHLHQGACLRCYADLLGIDLGEERERCESVMYADDSASEPCAP